MVNDDKRCPVTSGAFRCDKAAGHAGEHEARPTPRPWVGPAPGPTRRAPTLQLVGAHAHALERRQPSTSALSGAPASAVLASEMKGDPPPEAA